jgi:hypothetical protein
MVERFDLNKLMSFARHNGIGFTLSFYEASDELEIEILSASADEHLYMKRVPTIDYLIEKWTEHCRKKQS